MDRQTYIRKDGISLGGRRRRRRRRRRALLSPGPQRQRIVCFSLQKNSVRHWPLGTLALRGGSAGRNGGGGWAEERGRREGGGVQTSVLRGRPGSEVPQSPVASSPGSGLECCHVALNHRAGPSVGRGRAVPGSIFKRLLPATMGKPASQPAAKVCRCIVR